MKPPAPKMSLSADQVKIVEAPKPTIITMLSIEESPNEAEADQSYSEALKRAECSSDEE